MELPKDTTKKLAIMAGEYALAHASQIKVGSKGGDYRDVVTNIDIAISDMLKEYIKKKFPDDVFYSEEESGSPRGEGRVWAIDPIDGTSNYIRLIPFFSSVVSTLENGAVVASTVYNPVTKENFSLFEGVVTLNTEPVRVSEISSLTEAYVNFHPGRKEEMRQWAGDTKIALLGHVKKSANFGSSALDLCYVACGRTDILIYGTLTTLDIAGAIAMVRAAGGEVYNYDTKEPVFFSARPQKIIATANRALMEEYFEKIR